jgi:hypothetical protein
MSPMRLLLEGPDLQTLLETIRSEYGAEARIVQAEKVRRGGVAGFFARERFNIQVEVPRAPAVSQRAPIRGGSTVRSVMDLVDRLNREEEALHRDVIDAPQVAVHSPAKAVRPSASAARSGAPASSPRPSQGTVIRPSSAPSASMSTQSAAFAQVMSRLEQSFDSPVLPPTRVLPPTSPSEEQEMPVGADTGQSTLLRHTALESQKVAKRPPARSPLSLGAQMAARATRMGVPWYVLAEIEGPTNVYRRLLAWVESRPLAPKIVSAPGQVIVVVGEVEAAMRVAGDLAREVGVDPAAIHLAVPPSSTRRDVNAGQQLSDASDIALRRESWQQSAGSTFVVVEAALPAAAEGWLAAVVSALAPTFTWAVAQASTKVNDIVSWAAVIGGVDALALVNVAATGDPAAALAGPLPVGLLDGRRATVTYWMSMLTDEGERQ